jgi:diacylglycerol kinase (ATP)
VAVLVNPTKFDGPGALARFEREVDRALTDLGWSPTLWMPTTPSSRGVAEARAAALAGVDLVLVAGGDGTVRTVAQELLDTGLPLGLLPVGTGNLLARNLGVPLRDVEAATRLACQGHDRLLDVGWVELDRHGDGGDQERFCFLAMAGAGFDAAMTAGASDRLKRRLGAAAYLVSGIRALRRPLTAAIVRQDGRHVSDQPARGFVVGNCGTLTMGLALMPEADPTDGVLDGVVLLPRTAAGWLSLAWNVLADNAMPHRLMPRLRGRTIEWRSGTPQPVQVDGDVVGESRRVLVEVQPAALRVRCSAAVGPGARAFDDAQRPLQLAA